MEDIITDLQDLIKDIEDEAAALLSEGKADAAEILKAAASRFSEVLAELQKLL